LGRSSELDGAFLTAQHRFDDAFGRIKYSPAGGDHNINANVLENFRD
jgi:hypothetical protein